MMDDRQMPHAGQHGVFFRPYDGSTCRKQKKRGQPGPLATKVQNTGAKHRPGTKLARIPFSQTGPCTNYSREKPRFGAPGRAGPGRRVVCGAFLLGRAATASNQKAPNRNHTIGARRAASGIAISCARQRNARGREMGARLLVAETKGPFSPLKIQALPGKNAPRVRCFPGCPPPRRTPRCLPDVPVFAGPPARAGFYGPRVRGVHRPANAPRVRDGWNSGTPRARQTFRLERAGPRGRNGSWNLGKKWWAPRGSSACGRAV